MRTYQSTLVMNISENTTKYLQLFEKKRDNPIVPGHLRMVEMSTKKLKRTRKEEKTSGMNDRMMSVYEKLSELRDSGLVNGIQRGAPKYTHS